MVGKGLSEEHQDVYVSDSHRVATWEYMCLWYMYSSTKHVIIESRAIARGQGS